MVVGAFCFASMGAMTHALGTRCDWLLVGFVRAAFMCLTAVLLARMSGVKLVFQRPRMLWVRSLAGSFSLICNFYALARLPLADALTLTHTYPLWIVVLTTLALREFPTIWECLGVLCGVAGIVLIEQPHLDGDRLASVVALLSAFSTSVALLGLNRLRSVAPIAVMAHFAGVATLIAALGVLLRSEALLSFTPTRTTLLLLLGVALSGTAAQYCLTRAYTSGTPARLAVIGLSQVVFALVLDIALWNRKIEPVMALGFILVLGPSAWLAGLNTARMSLLNRSREKTNLPAHSGPPQATQTAQDTAVNEMVTVVEETL